MPVVPIPSSSGYDTVQDVLNSAGARLNDSLPSLFRTGSGVLNNTDAFSHAAFNSAYRRLQSEMMRLGSTRFDREVLIEGLPVCATLDPARQNYIDRTGFFDGVNFSTTPALPDDFRQPLWISERWTGQNAPFPTQPNMENMVGGLPCYSKQTYNRFWTYRDDKIYIPGAMTSVDFRLAYTGYLPTINDAGSIRWYKQEIPVMFSMDALSWLYCYELAVARAPGDGKTGQSQTTAALGFVANADAAIRGLVQMDVSMDQMVNVQRQPCSRRASSYSWNW